MPEQRLSVYLSDHLAGGVAALELLAHLQRAHVDTVIARAASRLRADVTADPDGALRLLESLEARRSGSKGSARSGKVWRSLPKTYQRFRKSTTSSDTTG
jgi:hypothetical protein